MKVHTTVAQLQLMKWMKLSLIRRIRLSALSDNTFVIAYEDDDILSARVAYSTPPTNSFLCEISRVVPNEDCMDSNSGVIDVFISSGQGTFTYLWNGNSGGDNLGNSYAIVENNFNGLNGTAIIDGFTFTAANSLPLRKLSYSLSLQKGFRPCRRKGHLVLLIF
ncbi:MAG: SprB repeat-containing protein [Bacteroidota bacterium]